MSSALTRLSHSGVSLKSAIGVVGVPGGGRDHLRQCQQRAHALVLLRDGDEGSRRTGEGGPQVAAHRVGRQPDDVVGHLGHQHRGGDGRVADPHGQLVAVDDTEVAGGRRGHPGDRGRGGAGEERLAVLQRPAVEQVAPGGEHEGAVLDARHVAGLDGRGGRAGALPRAEGRHLGAHLAHRAGAEELAHLVGEHVERAVVADLGGLEGRLEGADPALPVDEGAGLLGVRRDRQHDVGDRGDRRGADLERHDERAGEGLGGTGDAEVERVDPADDERVELTGCRRGDDAGRVAARGVGEGLHAPGGRHLGACRGIRERAATGQQGGQRTGLERTALTGAAGHPGEPGAGGLGEGDRGAQRTGDRREALADEHDGVVAQALARGGDDVGAGPLAEGAQHLGLGAGGGRDERAAHLGQAAGRDRGHGVHGGAVLAERLAQAQEDDRALVLGLQADEQHGAGRLEVGVGDRAAVGAGGHDGGGQEVGLLGGVRAGAEVDVVGAEHGAGELAVGVGVLAADPATDEHAGGGGGAQPRGRGLEGLAPGHDAQLTVGAAHLRQLEAVADRGVGEGPAALVAVPLLVHRRVVLRHPAQHRAAAVVGALRAAARAVLAHARGRHEVERAGAEAVGRAGEGADRADLHGVAGEVALERLVLVDADLLQRAALDERDERVAGDLVGEAGAPGAEHAALAVEQHLRGDVDRLGVGALDVLEAGGRAARAHRLVLQGALAALVAHRAVERVVDEQQLHDALLRLVGTLGRVLRLDDHAGGDGHRARGLRLHPAGGALHLGGLARRAVGAGATRHPHLDRGTGGRRRSGPGPGGRRTAGSRCRPPRRPG